MKQFLTIATLLSLSTSAWAQDKIILRGKDAAIDGIRITRVTCKKVFFVYLGQDGGEQSEEMPKVASFEIEPGHKSSDFLRGEEFLRRGEWKEAIDAFLRVKNDSKAAPVLHDMARWNVIQAWSGVGDIERLTGAVASLRKESPDSSHTLRAYEILADALRRSGKLDLLAKVGKEIEEAGRQNDMPDWSRAGELVGAGVLEAQGKLKEAIAVYRKSTGEKGDVGIDANLGLMRCQSAAKDWPALKNAAAAILANPKGKDARLLMGAYLGRADVAMYADKNLKDALLGYLLVTDVLSGQVGEQTLEMEIAMSHAAIACARMAGEAKDAESKQTYKGRAGELLVEARSRFGESGLTQLAETEIKNVK